MMLLKEKKPQLTRFNPVLFDELAWPGLFETLQGVLFFLFYRPRASLAKDSDTQQ